MIEPVNSRATSGASAGSSGLTSSVMIDAPAAARRVTRPWPISPPAPVMSTTGLRIVWHYTSVTWRDGPRLTADQLGGDDPQTRSSWRAVSSMFSAV